MNRIKKLMIICFAICACAYSAAADILPVEQNVTYSSALASNQTFLLRSGDIVHCLSLSYEPEYRNDGTCLVHMDANCYALSGAILQPCQGNCADRFQSQLMKDSEIPRHWTMHGLTISLQNNTYLIAQGYQVFAWMPNEVEPWQYVCTLDTTKIRDELHMIETFSVDGTNLYACFAYASDGAAGTIGEGEIYTFSLADGSCKKLCTMPTLYDVYPSVGNELLILGHPTRSGTAQWYLFDLSKSEMTPMEHTVSGGGNLLPVGKSGWYTVGEDGLYFISRNGTAEKIVSVPQSYQARMLSLSNDSSTAFFCGDGYLYMYPLSSKQRTLTLAGSLNEYGYLHGSLPDLTGFLTENPGVQIATVAYPSSFGELATELLTGSDRFDLMVVELSSTYLQRLLDKGYYVDLSDDKNVADFVHDMHSVWQSYCMNGEDIAAVPISVRSVWTLMYNRTIWEDERLEDVPATYSELFSSIKDWYEWGILDVYPLFGQEAESFDRLLHRVLTDFVGECIREGKPIKFQDATLLQLLEELESLRPILDYHDSLNLTGDALIYPEGMLTNIVHVSDERTEVYEPMPLSLTEENDYVESVFLTVAMINPSSDNIDLAKGYLSYIAEHPTAWAKCVLLKGEPEGVREVGYETATEQYEQLKPMLNQAIAEARSEGDIATALVLEKKWEEIVYNYREQWEVKPRMAAMLYQVLPHFTVLAPEGYGFLREHVADIVKMFEEGQIDSRTFVVRLDQRMGMMQEEIK